MQKISSLLVLLTTSLWRQITKLLSLLFVLPQPKIWKTGYLAPFSLTFFLLFLSSFFLTDTINFLANDVSLSVQVVSNRCGSWSLGYQKKIVLLGSAALCCFFTLFVHRVIEQFVLEWIFKCHLVQPSFNGQGCPEPCSN